MKKIILFTAFLVFYLSTEGQAQIENSIKDDYKTETDLRNWIKTKDFEALFDNNELLVNKIYLADKELELQYLPEQISAKRIKTAEKIIQLNHKLKKIYDVVPESRQLEVIFYESDYPATALGNQSLLLISSKSLELSDAEFFAALAHELGHLYFFEMMHCALEKKDFEQIRLIESSCDAVALVLLHKAGIDLTSLEKALIKINKLEGRNKNDKTADRYYDLDKRLDVLRGNQSVVENLIKAIR